jgi:TPP-dependent pyruvate/acetoin dehydrogenase alpha subunit
MQEKMKRTRAKSRRRPRSSAPRRKSDDSMKELLPDETLRLLYSTMLQCRMVKERVRQMFLQGKLTENSRSRAGREASEVGAAFGLQPEDCVAPRRQDVVTGFGFGCGSIPRAALKHALAKLLQPARPSRAQAFAARNGSGPRIIGGDSAMAARLNISTGVALAYQARHQPNVVVAFSGDDSTALGSWHDAVDFAVRHKLPIVHVVQSDAWTEPPDPRLLVAGKDTENAGQDSIPTLIVDGNDVVAVYRVAQECIRRARQGHGPSLMECKTQRWPGNTSDDAVDRMETYLKQKGLWSDAWKDRLMRSFTKQLDAAEKFADESAAKARS